MFRSRDSTITTPKPARWNQAARIRSPCGCSTPITTDAVCFPGKCFFPWLSNKDGWAKLGRSLRTEIDEELIASYRGTVSLPFDAGGHRRIAVKIVDDRGIESLKVIRVD